MTLDLDPNFRPFPEHEQLSFSKFTFPGGELHFKITTEINHIFKVIITHRVNRFQAMGEILLAADALKRAGVKHLELYIPYFPAARQDRVMVPGEPLTVKIMADLLNAQGFEKVTVFDPHSDVTAAVLHNCKTLNNHKFIARCTEQLPEDLLLVSPDGGALKKIYKLAQYLGKFEVVECSKSRNVRTGEITNFTVYSDDLQGRPCLLVDDICDGGGTFLGLAKQLKAKNAGPLYLAVSHGIFSKGFDALFAVFDTVFATNSFKDHPQHPQLVQLPLEDGVLL